jgi:glucose/arabinose dehydrogenase
VRVISQNGEPAHRSVDADAIEDFLTGFLIDKDHQFGRLAGLAVGVDGSLLISEDNTGQRTVTGIMYRVDDNGSR